jgi:hypothetical protein
MNNPALPRAKTASRYDCRISRDNKVAGKIVFRFNAAQPPIEKSRFGRENPSKSKTRGERGERGAYGTRPRPTG